MVKAKKADAKLARTITKGGGKQTRNNPFEIHTNRKKHDILGRKLKHERGLPGISRSKAIKKVSLFIHVLIASQIKREILILCQ